MRELTLMQITKYLYAALKDEGVVPSLYDHKRWHSLLYVLSNSNSPWAGLLGKIDFDWDGPFPRSPKLAGILHAFRVTHAGGAEVIDNGLVEYWNECMASCDIVVQATLQAMFQFAAESLKQYCTPHVQNPPGFGRRVSMLPR